jgi:hypothetical protein
MKYVRPTQKATQKLTRTALKLVRSNVALFIDAIPTADATQGGHTDR